MSLIKHVQCHPTTGTIDYDIEDDHGTRKAVITTNYAVEHNEVYDNTSAVIAVLLSHVLELHTKVSILTAHTQLLEERVKTLEAKR